MVTRAARQPTPVSFDGLLRLVRAGLAGAAATIVDLAVLALLVSVFGVSPRVASLPALV
jgi:putative flippase GtrA